MMVSKKNIGFEHDYNNPRFVKSFIEGMHQWLETKSKAGNLENKAKNHLEKQISQLPKKINAKTISKEMADKMILLGVDSDDRREFQEVFNLDYRLY